VTLPSTDFTTLILSLHHSALVHLGDAPHPNSEAASLELPLARQAIDMIAMLEEKTKGNLAGDEERLIHQVLVELRLRFVEMQSKA
jgi:hypothetical protein